MEPKKVGRKRPEAVIQQQIVDYLRLRQWFVKETHGNMYQSGFPDIFCSHRQYGMRWIEVKLPDMKGSKFTEAQKEYFPMFVAHNAGIWILTAATDYEYRKLFRAANLFEYFSLKYHS